MIDKFVVTPDEITGEYTKFVVTDTEPEANEITDPGWFLVGTIYNISYNLFEGISEAPGNTEGIVPNGKATIKFLADVDHTFPNSITVTGADYSWNNTSGELVLLRPTSDVEVTIIGKSAINYDISYNLTNVVADESNPEKIKESSKATLNFVSKYGYNLPDDSSEIIVSNATLESWTVTDNTNGTLVIKNPTDNVNISIEGKLAEINLDYFHLPAGITKFKIVDEEPV